MTRTAESGHDRLRDVAPQLLTLPQALLQNQGFREADCMQIPAIFSVVPSIMSSGLHLLGVDVSGGITKSTNDEPADSTVANKPGELGKTDLTSITPDDFSTLIDHLHESGQITADGYEQLKALRLELDLQRVPHDRPVDLPSLVRAKLDGLQDAGAQAPKEVTEQTRRQLQWLESISGRSGIDKLA